MSTYPFGFFLFSPRSILRARDELKSEESIEIVPSLDTVLIPMIRRIRNTIRNRIIEVYKESVYCLLSFREREKKK
jgi:hypothetical protein